MNFSKHLLAVGIGLAPAVAPFAKAGLVNVNLMSGTASGQALDGTGVLEPGDRRRFQMRIKPKNKRKFTVQICGSPSTLQTSWQDCVTTLSKVKGKL